MNNNQSEESSWANCNTIKTREDSRPYHFVKTESKKADRPPSKDTVPDLQQQPWPKTFDFQFCGTGSDWAPWGDANGFSKRVLHDRIEPWLTSLFQSEHLSLLLGSGLSRAVDSIVGVKGQSMDVSPFTSFQDEIERAAARLAKERGKTNCEDWFRVASELIQGLRVLGDSKADALEQELLKKKRE